MSVGFGRDVLRLFTDPQAFGRWFAGASWRAWHAVLHGLFGIVPDDPAVLAQLLQLTQLASAPTVACAIAVFVIGRGAGKSIVAAFLACAYALRDYSAFLAPGERAVIMLLAADRRQSRVLLRYIKGFFDAIPMLRVLVERETAEGLDLTNGVSIEIHTASFRSLRGYRVVVAILDEIAFWSIDGVNPDREILTALGPALARTPGSLLILISSPFARKGEFWRLFKQYFGKGGSDVFVVNADTLTMNSTFDAAAIARAFEDDLSAALAEYGADGRVEFRKDIESLISHELLERVIVPGRGDLPPNGGGSSAFFDGAGGTTFGADSMALAIGKRERGCRVVELIREVRPPFDPEVIIAQFAQECRRYGVRTVVGDRFAGSWPQAAFRKHGIEYREASLTKTELYREAMPAFATDGRVELPDNPVLKRQLLGLERRVTPSGREQIDHGQQKGQHDDVANVVAGVLYELREVAAERSVAALMPNGSSSVLDNSWMDPYFERGRSARRLSTIERLGLLEAPHRSEPSNAMQELREANQREIEAERQHHEQLGIIRRRN
jgi:hypothetical protein